MDYWEECISEAFDDACILATEDQVKTVADWIKNAHENYGMAHGHECIPHPATEENARLKKELQREKEKEVCPDCKGRGREVSLGPIHSAESDCFKCRGKGFLYY